MSGVHVSDRKPTPELLRYQVLAQGIDDAATRIAARSIPKSYRFIIGVQMADAANELAELVDLSLEFYPSNAVAANDRKRCYSRAVAKAKTLKRLMNKAMRLDLAKAADFEGAIAQIDEFIACVHGLKKSVKIKGIESAEDAIRWHKAQIAALDEIQSSHVAP